VLGSNQFACANAQTCACTRQGTFRAKVFWAEWILDVLPLAWTDGHVGSANSIILWLIQVCFS